MVKTSCIQCGKEFLTHACYFKRGGGKYCSYSCAQVASIKPFVKCLVDDCIRKSQCNIGYCQMHYWRIKKHGTIDIECIGQSRKGKRNGMYGVNRSGELGTFFGKKHSPESIEKIRIAKVGKTHREESNKKASDKLKGRIISEEHKLKISKAITGKIRSDETIKRIIKSLTGRKLSSEHRQKLSGSNSHNWKGGITDKNKKIRESLESRQWREKIFRRDNFSCVKCGAKGNLNADHIKPFALFPELRFDLSNGRTLCVPCHRKTDTYGGKSKKKNWYYD